MSRLLAAAAVVALAASGVSGQTPTCAAPGASHAIDLSAVSDLAAAPNSKSERDAFVGALNRWGVEGFESQTACRTAGCSDGETLAFPSLSTTATMTTTGSAYISNEASGSSGADRSLVGSNSLKITKGGKAKIDFGPEGVEAVGFYLNDWAEGSTVMTITCAGGATETFALDAVSLCGKSKCDNGAVGWWGTIRDAGNPDDRCVSIEFDMSGSSNDGHRVDEITIGYCTPPKEVARMCRAKFGDGGNGLCERSGSHALTFMSDIGSYTFKDSSGLWTVYTDGTAQLTGTINGYGGDFQLNYEVSGGQPVLDYCDGDPIDACGSPSLKFELKDASGSADGQCYVHNGGGPVDASAWTAFPGAAGGTASGLGAAAGYELSLAPRGPPLTEGLGAGNKNAGNGISSWFKWTVTATGSGLAKFDSKGSSYNGDINVDIFDCIEEAPIVPPCSCVETDCGCAVTHTSDDKCVCLDFRVTPEGEMPDCTIRPCTE